MYINYKIVKLEPKQTSTGKNKYNVILQDAEGKIEDNLSIWEGFPGYANLAVGSMVTGRITVSKDGKYRSLQEEKTQGFTKGTYKEPWKAGPSAAQERKEETIVKAQDRKDNSIQISASFRDATTLTVEWIATYKTIHDGPPSDDEIKGKWLEYRKWLLDNWEVDLSKHNIPF